MMLKHYSPCARLLFYGDGSPVADILRRMQADARKLARSGLRVGVLALDAEQEYFSAVAAVIVTLGATPEQVASRLFAAMRELDKAGVDVMLARGYERTGIGAALWERLLRAAEGEIVALRK